VAYVGFSFHQPALRAVAMSNLSSNVDATDTTAFTGVMAADYRDALIAYEAARAVVLARVSSARCPTPVEIENEERARAVLVSIRIGLHRAGDR
jgi:hypothetical protein